MDNRRYDTLVRLSGVAGLASAAILFVNAAKRSMIIPASSLTQLLAPLAEVTAVLFVLGLLLWSGLRAGLALTATVVNVVALALLVGVEFVINLVLSEVNPGVAASLLTGPAGIAFTVTSVAFLSGSVLLVLAFWRRSPRWALLTYGAGATLVSLRAFVPEVVLNLALAVMAVGIIALSIPLLTARRHAATVIAPH